MNVIPFPGRRRETPSGQSDSDRGPPRETFLWPLGSHCRLHRKPFDARLVLQQFPPPYSFARLRHAGEAPGLEITRLDASPGDIPPHRLPCVAWLRSPPVPEGKAGGDHPSDDPGETPDSPCSESAEALSGHERLTEDDVEHESDRGLVLIARNENGQLLYFHAGEDHPNTMESGCAGVRFEPVAYCARNKEEPAPSDEVDATPKKFGFRWFVPELLRYKRLWRGVLIASLFIQIFGLSMPLFTQVIIDKVIVHQTTNTLLAVAAALIMFVIFTGVMTWVWQLFITHQLLQGLAIDERLNLGEGREPSPADKQCVNPAAG